MLRTEFRKLATTFAASLEREGDIDRCVDVLAEALDQIGFPMVTYSFMPVARLSDGTWMPPPLKFRNLPPRWEVRWTPHSAHDPYYHACYTGAAQVDWSDIQKRQDLSQLERDSWNYLADWELHKAVTVPIHLPGRRFAFVTGLWRGSLGPNGNSHAVNSLFLIAHYFHASMYSKFKNPFKAKLSAYLELSERELQCLTWAAHGKTASETAQILDRSVETVRDHLRNAVSKLDALNCVHAIAKAVFLGMMPPLEFDGVATHAREVHPARSSTLLT